MDYLFLAGRILFGGFFVNSGVNHFRNLQMMAGYAGMKGVPAPKAAVAGSGLLIFFGGLCVILGCQPTWVGVLLLTAFLIPVTLTMHNFWVDTDPMMKINNQVNFGKNVALLGAAWMFLLIPQPWPMSLTW